MAGRIIQTDIPLRLDRLPWGRFHVLVVIALGVTWILDGLEVTLAGSVAGALKESPTLQFSNSEIGLATSAYLAGAVLGAILFGWLTDRLDSRLLLGVYYALRGASLLVLPDLFADAAAPSLLVFVVFYGLDWVATVPPTVALCREHFGADGAVVFGWVFASHQVGAAIAATAAGLVRDRLGEYTVAWYAAGALCFGAALLSLLLRRNVREPAATGVAV
mgnify:CR=1 FL=1